MNIDKNIIETLKRLYLIFREKEVRWVLVGSLSLAIQGVDVKPRDIDILIDERDIQKVRESLKDYEVKPITLSKSKYFESYLGEYYIGNIKVEIMAKLREYRRGVWRDLTTRLHNPVFIELDDLLLPVSSLKEQLESYENVGRKKDYNKIAKIKEALNQEEAVH
jgi:hypothetical protein